jgi:hypothetical protein
MAKKSKRRYSGGGRIAQDPIAARNEFNPDYTYVKRDLARIGVLAGSFFAILILLSFFLR